MDQARETACQTRAAYRRVSHDDLRAKRYIVRRFVRRQLVRPWYSPPTIPKGPKRVGRGITMGRVARAELDHGLDAVSKAMDQDGRRLGTTITESQGCVAG